MDKKQIYNELQRKYSKPNFFSTPNLEKLTVEAYAEGGGKGSTEPRSHNDLHPLWAAVAVSPLFHGGYTDFLVYFRSPRSLLFYGKREKKEETWRDFETGENMDRLMHSKIHTIFVMTNFLFRRIAFRKKATITLYYHFYLRQRVFQASNKFMTKKSG